jgi:hypothetical protein
LKLAHSFHADQVLAGSAWLHIVFGCAGKLHAVEQEKILLGTIAGNRTLTRS